MIDDTGIFRTSIDVTPFDAPIRRMAFSEVMVDTGSEYTWLPEEARADLGVTPVRVERFQTADARIIERFIGFVMIFAGGRSGPTIVVFAQPGEMALLGAHALEGLNLRIDLVQKELVPAGPVPVTAAA